MPFEQGAGAPEDAEEIVDRVRQVSGRHGRAERGTGPGAERGSIQSAGFGNSGPLRPSIPLGFLPCQRLVLASTSLSAHRWSGHPCVLNADARARVALAVLSLFASSRRPAPRQAPAPTAPTPPPPTAAVRPPRRRGPGRPALDRRGREAGARAEPGRAGRAAEPAVAGPGRSRRPDGVDARRLTAASPADTSRQSAEQLPLGQRHDGHTSSFGGNVAVGQLLPVGHELPCQLRQSRSTTNNCFAASTRSWTGNLDFTVVQPLLRNFKVDTRRYQV